MAYDYLAPAAIRHPVIGQAHFRDILSVNGINITIRKRAATASQTDCGCLDAVYRRPDPNCSKCSGSGLEAGWTQRLARAFIVEKDPHGADGAGRIITTGGEIERADCYAYFLPGTDVNDEDLIIYRGVEFLVKNKVIRNGTHAQPIYIRCELWKTSATQLVVSARV